MKTKESSLSFCWVKKRVERSSTVSFIHHLINPPVDLVCFSSIVCFSIADAKVIDIFKLPNFFEVFLFLFFVVFFFKKTNNKNFKLLFQDFINIYLQKHQNKFVTSLQHFNFQYSISLDCGCKGRAKFHSCNSLSNYFLTNSKMLNRHFVFIYF